MTPRIIWAFDSVVLAAVAVDLQRLIGSAVSRVLQPDRDELSLSLRGRTGAGHILCSIHPRWARVHLVEAVDSGTVGAFGQLLRARLEGARLREITQPAFERTLALRFGPPGDSLDVIAEIMGRHSNIVAVHGGQILGSLKKVTASMSAREILPGLPYTRPPQRRPTLAEVTPADLRTAIEASPAPLPGRLTDAVLGLSPLLAAELVARSGLTMSEAEPPAGAIVDALWPVITDLVARVTDQAFSPVMYVSGTLPVGFAPFPYTHLAGLDAVPTPTMSDAVAAVGTRLAASSRLEERRAALREVITPALARVNRTQAALHLAQSEAARGTEQRQLGELLLAYSSQIPPGSREITLPGFDGQPVRISLDPQRTPVENARRVLERYSRLKSARSDMERRLGEAHAQEEYLKSVVTLVDTATSMDDLAAIRAELVDQGIIRRRPPGPRAAPKAGPRTFATTRGHRVIVGRSNVQNDEVTFKAARPDDLWFHARGIAGAHTVLKADGHVSEEDIREAAQIAAYFSAGRGGSNVPVSYTLRKYVKKPKGAKPGLVTISHEKTIVVEPALPV